MEDIQKIANEYNLYLTGVNENIIKSIYLKFIQKDLQYLFTTSVYLLIQNLNINKEIKCIGSKNPILIKSIELYPSFFPDCKYIHIVRDGTHVMVSAWFNNLRGNKEDAEKKWPDFKSFVQSVIQQ